MDILSSLLAIFLAWVHLAEYKLDFRHRESYVHDMVRIRYPMLCKEWMSDGPGSYISLVSYSMAILWKYHNICVHVKEFPWNFTLGPTCNEFGSFLVPKSMTAVLWGRGDCTVRSKLDKFEHLGVDEGGALYRGLGSPHMDPLWTYRMTDRQNWKHYLSYSFDGR